MQEAMQSHEVSIGASGLKGILAIPDNPLGLVIFAHGSGSGRLSPRNNHVARGLESAGLATLLMDLLTHAEERDRANVFDIGLLAERLSLATDWAAGQAEARSLPIGYFGASTGAGAALVAAAGDERIGAVVSRGGRPDLAGGALPHVTAPTLLIVGSLDGQVIELNRLAHSHMRCERQIVIVPGASHLFEEPGTLDQVIVLARNWFAAHLAPFKEKNRGN